MGRRISIDVDEDDVRAVCLEVKTLYAYGTGAGVESAARLLAAIPERVLRPTDEAVQAYCDMKRWAFDTQPDVIRRFLVELHEAGLLDERWMEETP